VSNGGKSMKKKFIRVDDWKPTKAQSIVKYDGKMVVFPFDKIFNKPTIDALNNFIIKKESYVKKLGEITHYINYFLEFYDKDKEVIMAYLKLKFLIDNKDNHITLPSAIKMIYDILLTEETQQKVIQMVEDNYYIDLSSDTGIKYNESLEFTTEHAKVMMQISVSMKLMIPIMFHYLNSNNMIKQKKLIYRFYEGLFDMYGGEIDIYNKLFVSVFSKINVNFIRNKTIWAQREIFGTNPLTHMKELLHEKIISETMFKYEFSKNVVSFNYVVLDKQLRFFLIEPYAENRIELSATKNADGLSGIDKLEMNSTKMDESSIILSNINIKKTIERIIGSMHIKIDPEEIEYYKENMNISKFHTQLVFYYYAKYFNGFRDLLMLNRMQYITLVVIMKKRLQMQNYVFLPQLLTANIDSKLNSRTIRNDKFLSKIKTSSIYQTLISDKYCTLEDADKGDLILNILSTLINTTFTFVDYEHPEVLGQAIEVNQDMISEEYLNFLNQL